MLKAEAVAIHFEDVDMVGEAVEQGSGKAFEAEDLGPFGEGQVRSEHGRTPFIALAEHLEEQLGASMSAGVKIGHRAPRERCSAAE